MVHKNIWGSATWNLFHSMAFKLKPGNEWLVPALYAHIVQLSSSLPCPDCSDHATAMWSSYPFHVATKQDLVMMLFRGHNVVNRRLGKKLLSIDEHDKRYTLLVFSDICNHYSRIMLKTDGSDLRLTDSLHRKRAVQELMSLLKTHWHCFAR